MIYTDVRKAFDTVNHSVLIKKLKLLGLSNPLLFWITEYLQERHQLVRVNDTISKQFPVTSEVPQGGHVSPILFLLFVNYVTQSVKRIKISLFADNLKLYLPVESFIECTRLQNDLNAFVDWCKFNGLYLNVSKCNIISFPRSRNLVVFNYTINESMLPRVSSLRN